MDSSMGGVGGSGDNSHKGRSYKRLSTAQTFRLEKFIVHCPHPDEAQRYQIAAEVGLEPKQVKFWFQNKRTQLKTRHERADNTALRIENNRIHTENIFMREALKNILCDTCGGAPFPEDEHKKLMEKIKLENAQLKDEHDKVSKLISRHMEKQVSQTVLQQTSIPIIESLYDQTAESSSSQPINIGIPCLDQSLGAPPIIHNGDNMLSNSLDNVDIEKTLMLEVIANAIEELVKLLRVNEPLWVNSSTLDGKLSIHREIYGKLFPRTNHFSVPNVHVESSKHLGVVNLGGVQLVKIFLDPEKWVTFFPTLVTKVETIKVLESGSSENRSGALQLMYEEMHGLSPLVQPREFRFLRYCLQADVGTWVIMDVSYDSFHQQNTPLSHSWKHPSGCLIQEMPNGCSMVTWVEHVEVDDMNQTHQLYRDLVGNSIAYGAERWVMELQRNCERFARFYDQKIFDLVPEGVINSLEGKRSIMALSQRMVKSFCGSLAMSEKLDFSHIALENNGEVKFSVHKNMNIGKPKGIIIAAATSLWLPFHYQEVFQFFKDNHKRPHWDVLSCGNPMKKIVQVSNGIHPDTRNCISIIQPFIPNEDKVMILQESFIDPMGCYVVYAPIDVASVNVAMRGEDSSVLEILPSGFVICGNDHLNYGLGAFNSGNVNGSLMTVFFQILGFTDSFGINQLNMESVAAMSNLLISTVQKIKDALNCNNLEM